MMYKKLEKALHTVAQTSLACLPTPFQRLKHLESQWGYPDIFIKRDDLTGLGPGGNKLRNLEFLLGDALSLKADIILASGPVQSNLCSLVAAACAKLGLRCVLVHNGEKPLRREGNVLLNHLLGAESYYLGKVSSQERDAYVNSLAKKLSKGCTPYVIKNGGTSGRGVLGYVKAISELYHQVETVGLPGLTVFIPAGNGGIASGLIYGNTLCNLPLRIVVVSVENDKNVLTANIEHTIHEAESLLGLPFLSELKYVCEITDRYRGDGWGINTPESSKIIAEFSSTEGIVIENVYNSKVLVAMHDYIRSGKVKGPICFLHTGGFGSLFSQY
ncbi:1-aminocyclopropane-1-carboxylate deaminase/D-cysteine desulfhydrase [Murdochiella massiliensis]|uniref:1-aminocyclopropane-1-carboxylate deaminase/D-cysteine desulfhydrase n=1 Tax=Murdochiella massiliensis TaxID=1673723 RepID=UPI00082D1DEC|nr:pyridoxal-phosphate dependent enzyme [Murdochiella massiliensis]